MGEEALGSVEHLLGFDMVVAMGMSADIKEKYLEWCDTRPTKVRDVARKFIPGTRYTFPGHPSLWLLGFSETESDEKIMLMMSPVNPFVDYDGAVASEKVYICSDHIAPDMD